MEVFELRVEPRLGRIIIAINEKGPG